MILNGFALVLYLSGVLPSSASIFNFPAPTIDCVEAHRVCSVEPTCEALYRGLELCAEEAAVSPQAEQLASECVERRDALLAKHPSLLTCKCQRGFRKEELCLRIYWRVRLLPGEVFLACCTRRRAQDRPKTSWRDIISQLSWECPYELKRVAGSRLADFLNNCQPSHLTASGCLKDSAGLCLRAYAGLIGTIMTPNYISNSSADVSLWCNCEGSGNQWQECLKLQRIFTHNSCLRNSISWMGSLGLLPADITQPPAPRPSPLVQKDELLKNNHLPEHNNIVLDSKEEEELTQTEDEQEGADSGQFDVIPLYSERATVSNLGSSGTGGSTSLTTGPSKAMLLLLLLLSLSLSWL
ncbi:GDNF family receptor alpha-2-like [Neolamprologus brichardi]|uniref:GDNF family receptor alpha-2-like n=1 Tax=Neolamprologus brichardi TaxID=32507 RepID=UPI0003EC66A1|nr:GDNF family receptor alpha-2-like [Neolamprologus brichardi]